MEFVEYLKQKKIDPVVFQKSDSLRYEEWQNEFATMHPESFTAQKKFLINNLRRRYTLTNPE